MCIRDSAHTEYRSPGLIEREVKRVGLIVISTDRGLCGGLNTNLFKATIAAMQQWRGQGVEVDLCTIGTKAFQFFRRLKGNVVAHVAHLGDAPRFEDVLGPVKVMADAFTEGRVDAVHLVYNEFVNTMTQKPRKMCIRDRSKTWPSRFRSVCVCLAIFTPAS